MKALDILPVFLEKRDEEVHGESDILHELLLGHLDIADSHAQTQHLLHLELDGGLGVINLLLQVIHMCNHGGEFSGLKHKDSSLKMNFVVSFR